MDTMSLSDLVGATVSRFRLASEARRLGAKLHETLHIDLPDSDAVDLAARYRPANASVAAGGDFAEVSDLGDAIAVVIGDVVGHGVDAAVRSVQLRSDLATALLVTRDPAEALGVLDQRAIGRGERCVATAMCLLVEPALGVAHVATAGHPPPLVVAADLSSEWLRVEAGPPVGVGDGRPPSTPIALDAHDTVLCFTDGVIESPGALLDDGVAHLAARVARLARRGDPRRDLEERFVDLVVDAAMDAAIEFADGRDDSVALALSIRP